MRMISDLYNALGRYVHAATIKIVFKACPRDLYSRGQVHQYMENVLVYWDDLSDSILMVVSALIACRLFTRIVEKSIALLSGTIIQPPGQHYQMIIRIDDSKPDYLVLIESVDIKSTSPGAWSGMSKAEMMSKIVTDMVTGYIMLNGMRDQ